MILEKEISVCLTNRNISHYENKGYEIPRYIDKQGRLKAVVNHKISVKIEDLPKNSEVILTKICDICGKHIHDQKYGVILRNRNKENGKDRCFDCSRIGYRIKDIPYEKSFEFFAKNNGIEYLLEEFSSKNNKQASEISYGTNDKYLWNCPNCKGEFSVSVASRTNLTGCPYCCTPSRKILIGFNDLWTTHPEVAMLLTNKSKGYELSVGSNKKEEFKCNNCGFIGKKLITNVVKRGFQCPKCSDGFSYPEKLLFNVFEQLEDLKFNTQKSFEWSNNKRYDFYISSLNCIIETHGEQHYRHTGRGRSLKEEQENDKTKKELALNNGIDNYIIIDCRKSNLPFIRNNIIKSKLSSFLDLYNINWSIANEFASTSYLLKTICGLWNTKEMTKSQIGIKLKINRNTVVNYIKQGAELGWCNYENNEAKPKAVVQLTMHDEFVREFTSTSEASRCLNIQQPSISRVCNGKMKSTGGFKWLFKSDFDQS